MANWDKKDLVGGGLLALFGCYFIIESFEYGIGTADRMQAGFVPAVLGVIAVILGGFMAVPALFRAGTFPAVSWRPIVAVLCGIGAFALLIERAGFVISIMAAVAISAFGDKEARPAHVAALAVSVCVLCWLVFIVGLKLPIPAFGS